MTGTNLRNLEKATSGLLGFMERAAAGELRASLHASDRATLATIVKNVLAVAELVLDETTNDSVNDVSDDSVVTMIERLCGRDDVQSRPVHEINYQGATYYATGKVGHTASGLMSAEYEAVDWNGDRTGERVWVDACNRITRD